MAMALSYRNLNTIRIKHEIDIMNSSNEKLVVKNNKRDMFYLKVVNMFYSLKK